MSTFSDFKANPSISTYLDWVREGYTEYSDALIEQDLGVGSDVYLLYEAARNEGEKEAKEAWKDYVEPIIDSATEWGVDLGAATLNVIENSGIALIKGAGKTRDYFVEEIGDRKVTFVKQFTILIIVLITTIFIYNQLLMKDR